jgi:DNA-binding MarR family transcriptional regulator
VTVETKPGPSSPELAAHLRATVGALVRSTRGVDALAPIPAAVLDLLDLSGPLTTADLAARRGVRHQTMATTVKELVEAGLLAAAGHPGDARKKLLTLTSAGKQAIDADRRRRVGVLADAIDEALDDEDRRVLSRALDLIDQVAERVAGSDGRAPTSRGPITGAW